MMINTACFFINFLDSTKYNILAYKRKKAPKKKKQSKVLPSPRQLKQHHRSERLTPQFNPFYDYVSKIRLQRHGKKQKPFTGL
jgi:hypothetical protein